jgi:hypothetical protein
MIRESHDLSLYDTPGRNGLYIKCSLTIAALETPDQLQRTVVILHGRIQRQE